jgi:hypothetical protein
VTPPFPVGVMTGEGENKLVPIYSPDFVAEIAYEHSLGPYEARRAVRQLETGLDTGGQCVLTSLHQRPRPRASAPLLGGA